ncbi:hypothetical protein ACJJTC_002128, partial [Scirpophaga incertulas]
PVRLDVALVRDRTGSGRISSGRTGSGRTGSGRTGSGRTAPVLVAPHRLGAEPHQAAPSEEGEEEVVGSGSVSGSGYTTEKEVKAAEKTASSTGRARGRGRPPTTGEYVGLAQAKRELLAVEKTEQQARLDREIAETERKAYATRARFYEQQTDSNAGASSATAGEKTTADLEEVLNADCQVIIDVAKKSSRLSGPFQKALKKAVQSIQDCFGEVARKTVSDDARILRAENEALKKEVTELRNSLAELGNEVRAIKKASSKEPRRPPSPVDVMETDSAPPPPSDVAPGRQPSPPPQPFTPPSEKEELMREMMLRIGGLINARFEASVSNFAGSGAAAAAARERQDLMRIVKWTGSRKQRRGSGAGAGNERCTPVER